MVSDVVKVLKRPTNVSMRSDLLETAKRLKINVSRAAEQGVALAVAEAQAEKWKADNQAALESSNAFVDQRGIPLARFRRF